METVEEISVYKEPAIRDSRGRQNMAGLKEGKKTLHVLSLFSGCGGMDLGFEGSFPVLDASINKAITPGFIEKKT